MTVLSLIAGRWPRKEVPLFPQSRRYSSGLGNDIDRTRESDGNKAEMRCLYYPRDL